MITLLHLLDIVTVPLTAPKGPLLELLFALLPLVLLLLMRSDVSVKVLSEVGVPIAKEKIPLELSLTFLILAL